MTLLAPSRTSKTAGRRPSLAESAGRLSPLPPSPTLPSSITASSSGQQTVIGSGWRVALPAKPPLVGAGIHGPLGLIEKSREPLPMVLQQPEVQTDNWDDDFLEGISLTKLHGLDKTAFEEEKTEPDDGVQTIRANKSPSNSSGKMPLATAPSADMSTIVEDYSDFAAEEDDVFADKVADFKLKNGSRRGLFHPNDIKTVGLAPSSPGPQSAPLLDMPSKSPRPGISPISSRVPSSSSIGRSHSRSSSFAGSMGRAEAVKAMQNQEFDKYAEEPDEDYEDVFGKPNGTGAYLSLISSHLCADPHRSE